MGRNMQLFNDWPRLMNAAAMNGMGDPRAWNISRVTTHWQTMNFK